MPGGLGQPATLVRKKPRGEFVAREAVPYGAPDDHAELVVEGDEVAVERRVVQPVHLRSHVDATNAENVRRTSTRHSSRGGSRLHLEGSDDSDRRQPQTTQKR